MPIESGLNQETRPKGNATIAAQRNRPGKRSGETAANAIKTGTEPAIRERLGIKRSRRSVMQTQTRVSEQEIPEISEIGS